MDNSRSIENSMGSVRIADEVVEVIAGMAASEVDGVAELSGSLVWRYCQYVRQGEKCIFLQRHQG